MPIELFGFTIGKTQKDKEASEKASFALPQSEDGSLDVYGNAGGAYGTYIDMEGSAKNDIELISRYRQMALYPECELAVDDIVNDAIVSDREMPPVTINLENLNLSPDIKEKITENFNEIIKLLNFREHGFDIFRKWYIDGRIFYHIIIDQNNPKRGVLELRPLDSLKIKKIRQVIPPKSQDPKAQPIIE